MRVLVVDDSRAIRAVITRMLTQLGHEHATAGNGQEALDAVHGQGPFDLALVDWNMPVMNGLDFVRSVRADARFEEMKIMMVTTETEIERISMALESGATEYLMKPFTQEALVDKLALMGFDQAA
jgi:two-component system, chemotaxis family, chemotaxis protein CheY